MAVIDDRVEHEIRIQAPLEVVFTYLIDPDKHSAWMGQQVTLDPRPGGIYRCVMHEQATVTGEYLIVDPPHRVVFSWGFEGDQRIPRGSSTVEVTLTPDGSAPCCDWSTPAFPIQHSPYTTRAGTAIWASSPRSPRRANLPAWRSGPPPVRGEGGAHPELLT